MLLRMCQILRLVRSMTVFEQVFVPLSASTRKVSSSAQQLSLSKQIFKRYCQPKVTWSGVRISSPNMSNFLTFLVVFLAFLEELDPMEWSDSSEDEAVDDDEEELEDSDEEDELSDSILLRMEAV